MKTKRTKAKRVKDMSNDELVETVKFKVMGWDHSIVWRPLADWEHCRSVFQRADLWLYARRKRFNNLITDNGNRWYADITQRDILEAALMVVEGES